jgi:WD40 repeat protein/energy-coupling factor transporter ATP-binding protein EcfA2
VLDKAAAASATRPFIGLRPFEFEDRSFFFGRRDSVDAVESLVRRSRFVAIVGSSGTGKSSLVKAGLLPRLKSKEGDNWQCSTMEPGEAPIERLARAISSLKGSEEEFAEASKERVELCLRRSKFGIADGIALVTQETQDVHFVLIVDQFEELFRFADLRSEPNNADVNSTINRDEATAFVRLLLAPSNLDNTHVHIVITMRSDFIGECAHFHGLPEAVTKSQFLVPGLTRDQRATAIRGPIEAAGARIDPELVQRVLNDTSEDPDQLPIIQHAMMRCWSFASERAKLKNEAQTYVSIEDYTKIGGVKDALSIHANQILDEMKAQTVGDLTVPTDIIVKRIFQSLTEVDLDGRVVRRPLKLIDLQETVAPMDENHLQTSKCIKQVVERLVRSDCNFLRLTSLADDAIVDIGHEALIRRWSKLKGGGETDWIREEQEDAERYRDLVRIANGGGTISAVELPRYELWWQVRMPGRVWARRYNKQSRDRFDEARSVLTRSREAVEAEKRREIAEYETRLKLAASESAKEVEAARAEAADARASVAEALAKVSQAELKRNLQRIRLMRVAAASGLIITSILAFTGYNILTKRDMIKANEKLIAEQQKQKTDLISARAMGLLSRPELSGAADALNLLLYKADSLVYTRHYQDALYRSLQSLREVRRIIELPRPVLSVSANPRKPLIVVVTAGSPPVMNFYKVEDSGKSVSRVTSFPIPISLSWVGVRWSPDGERLFVGGTGPAAVILTPCGEEALRPYFVACDGGTENKTLQLGDAQHQAGVGSWSGDGTRVLTSTFQGEINVWNSLTGKLEPSIMEGVMALGKQSESKQISAVALSPSGKRIAVGEYSGVITIINTSKNQIDSVLENDAETTNPMLMMFNPANEDQLFVSYQASKAVLWSIEKKKEIISRPVPNVFQVAFDPKGEFLVTASNDALVRLWKITGASNSAVVEMRGHIGPVFSVDVGPDGVILSGGTDRTARLWTANAAVSEDEGIESGPADLERLKSLASQKLPYINTTSARIALPSNIACVLSNTCGNQ